MDDLNIKFIEGKDKKSPLVIINSFDSGNELIKLSNECKKDFMYGRSVGYGSSGVWTEDSLE